MIPHICILIPSLFSLYQSLYLSHSNLSLTFFCCKRYCFYSLSLSLTWPLHLHPPAQTTQAYNCLTITGLLLSSSPLFFLALPFLFCDVIEVRLIYLKLATTSHLSSSLPPIHIICRHTPILFPQSLNPYVYSVFLGPYHHMHHILFSPFFCFITSIYFLSPRVSLDPHLYSSPNSFSVFPS